MITEADVAAVTETLESGWLTMGPRTQAFEAALAEYLGAEHVVTVSSGTAALHLACIAAGLGPGDEVIVPAQDSPAAPTAVRRVGATPIASPTDPDDVALRTTPSTRAVIAARPWGRRSSVPIECLSFGAGSPLEVGEGGAVVTDDEDVAKRVRLLRSHAMTTVTWDRHRGYAESYDVIDVGFNYRLDEPRAALAHSKLERLDREIEGASGAIRHLLLPVAAGTDVAAAVRAAV